MSISLYDLLRQQSQEGDDVFGMIALNDEKNLLVRSSPVLQRLAGGFVIRSPVVTYTTRTLRIRSREKHYFFEASLLVICGQRRRYLPD